jgi:hypothetical protein
MVSFMALFVSSSVVAVATVDPPRGIDDSAAILREHHSGLVKDLDNNGACTFIRNGDVVACNSVAIFNRIRPSHQTWEFADKFLILLVKE